MVAHRPRWLVSGLILTVVIAANLGIGMGAAAGQHALAVALTIGFLPALLIGFGALVESHRAMLAWAAFALNFTGVPFFSQALPLPGDTKVFPADVLLVLALGAWLASRLSGVAPANPVRLSPVFGWPLALLGVTVMAGVLVGHERYGTSIIGEPVRLLLYAGIALALTDVSVTSAWRAITVVFYTGAVVQALWAVYYLATGTSQTGADILSTGGVRVLALSVAIYLLGSLVCALLNLEIDPRPGRQALHLVIAGLALFGIVVSFGRTTYAAAVLLVPLVLAARRFVRRTVLLMAPLFVPVVAIAALLVPTVAPTILPTLQARLIGTSTNDSAVEWRTRALDAVLEGVDDEWLTGVGFGRVSEFEFVGQIVRLQGDPHNSYIWILAGGGVIALGALLLVYGMYVVDAVRRLRRADSVGQALIVWSLATWLAFALNAFTGPILTDPEMLMATWVLVALPSVVALRPDP